MSRKRKRKISRAIAEAKNAVRGAMIVGKPEVLDAVARALNGLGENDVSSFATWVKAFPAKRTRVFAPSKANSYEELWPKEFTRTHIKNLGNNIRWVSSFLQENTKAVSQYLRMLFDYEVRLLVGEYDKALQSLDEIEREIGYSIWAIEARIWLLHRNKGLEAQKD
jgi:hypothetical protein